MENVATKTQELQPLAPVISDEEIIGQYKSWRSNPNNEKFEDHRFCSGIGVSIDKLLELKQSGHLETTQIISEKQIIQMVQALLVKMHSQILKTNLPFKSLEGATTSFTALAKQLLSLTSDKGDIEDTGDRKERIVKLQQFYIKNYNVSKELDKPK